MNLLNVTLTELPEWVLIDTWWNVNSSERSRCKQDSVRFNRYMVECEFVIILESNEAPERF